MKHDESAGRSRPQCGQGCCRHDTRRGSQRHLVTCQFRDALTAEARVRCPEHVVLQLAVPWTERGSRFTATFESLAIESLREANLTAVSRRLRVSRDELDEIQLRAVPRGLARRATEPIVRLGVGETAFQRRHEYVTVIRGLERGRVVHVANGRGQAALAGFYRGLAEPQRPAIEAVEMDRWRPDSPATQAQLPGWATAVCSDHFHAAKHLGEAVNDVRKCEQRGRFDAVRGSTLKVARSRLERMRNVARMLKEHLWGVINAVVHGVTNGTVEIPNAKIQRVTKNACGFRVCERLRTAILFHCGGLDLDLRPATQPIS